MTRLAVALVALACGCGPVLHGADHQTLPVGDDPLALLPSGAELVMDVDVVQLRVWPATRRFLALLPPDARARLARLGFDPLGEVDALYLAANGLGTDQASSTILFRGDLDLDKARAALGPAATLSPVDYRGTTITVGPNGALARILPQWFALGSRADVMRVVDLARGEGVSLRAADQQLLAAFGRCPTAKTGRPAVMAALLPPEPLRQALEREGLPGADIEWLAVSFAVGDGFDVGAIAGFRGPAEAASAVHDARGSLADFSSRKTIRLLGLKPFLDPIILVARGAEVHLAYRLGGPIVDRMLSRLEAVNALAHGDKPQ